MGIIGFQISDIIFHCSGGISRRENIGGFGVLYRGREYERFGYGVERMVEEYKHENIVHRINIRGGMIVAPPLHVS